MSKPPGLYQAAEQEHEHEDNLKLDSLLDMMDGEQEEEVMEWKDVCLDDICPVDDSSGAKKGNGFIGRKQGDGPGEWRQVKVTKDSGATVDVMPADWLPHVPVTPCTGPRKGKRLAAANNTVITQVGEKRLCGKTDDGYKIDCSFIACDVKKALKSTASTCDDGHWVVHT